MTFYDNMIDHWAILLYNFNITFYEKRREQIKSFIKYNKINCIK